MLSFGWFFDFLLALSAPIEVGLRTVENLGLTAETETILSVMAFDSVLDDIRFDMGLIHLGSRKLEREVLFLCFFHRPMRFRV